MGRSSVETGAANTGGTLNDVASALTACSAGVGRGDLALRRQLR